MTETEPSVFCTSGPSKYLEKVHGDCLERCGIQFHSNAGGYAVVKKVDKVQPGDVVICNKISGQVLAFCKRVLRVKQMTTGQVITVGTAYTNPARDFEFEACEIMGEVVEIYDTFDGGLIWEKVKDGK